jgi:hypothetical protein
MRPNKNRRLWHTAAMHWPERIPLRTYLIIAAALIAVQAAVLYAFGQPPICKCGTVKLWQGVVNSPENSQQLTDWYSFTHILHGFIFYGLLSLIAPRAPIGLRFAIAVGIEAGWEILENSPIIIERYRRLALAQGYFGDSIVNSVSDTLAMTFGFLLARKLPALVVAGLAVAEELIVGFIIRDNLTLNVIQLIHPFEAISRWQAGG